LMLFLRLTPMRGVVLNARRVDRIYEHDLIPFLSEEIFQSYDWSIGSSIPRVVALLQHRFGSFKRWCMQNDNLGRFPPEIRSMVRMYSMVRSIVACMLGIPFLFLEEI
jgi:hypothetical protein